MAGINYQERDSAEIIVARWQDNNLRGLDTIDHGEARRSWGKMFVRRLGPFDSDYRPRVMEENGMIVSYLPSTVPKSPPQNQALERPVALKAPGRSITDR
jgi:hypothetical protein